MQKNLSISLVASFLLATNLFSAQNLETITVTSATKSAQSIKDVTSNVEVITKEEIQERHFTSVPEALNSLSGINVISNGGLGTSASVKLRGFDTKRVLVLIDGIRVNDVTGTSGAPFEHLMINDIERIEVVKGAQSGIWGADASAGVINIITSSAKKGFHGSVNTEYGEYDTKKIKTDLSYKENDYYVKGSVSSLNTNGFTAQAPKETKNDYLEDDGYENITANVKFGYEFNDSNKIDLSHTLINARTEYDGCGNNKWKTSFGGYYSCTDTAIQKADNDSYYSKTQDTFSSANFNHVNDFNQIDIYTNRSVFDREYNNIQSYTGGANDGKTLSSKNEFDGTLDEFGIKSTIPYLNDTSSLIVGGDYKVTEYKNDINKDYNNKGLFATNSNKLFDNTIFTQSLRADDYNKFEDKTTAKIGLKHFINDDLNVSSNYGTAYNVPTLYNLYSEYGNENINPEKTKSFDINLGYKGLGLTYFNNKIKDMIDYDFGTSKYNNLDGETALKGYEVSYKEELIEDTIANVSYTHLRAENDENQDLRRSPRQQLKYGIDYYGINDFHFNVNGQYTGAMYEKDNKSGVKTGEYTIWNTIVNYDINKTYKAYLKVDNLFDKYYQTIDGYATAERSAYVGLKASF